MGMDYHVQLFYVDGQEQRRIDLTFGKDQSDSTNLDAMFRNYTVFDILQGKIRVGVHSSFDFKYIDQVEKLTSNNGHFSEQRRQADHNDERRSYLFGHNTITLNELNQLVTIFKTSLEELQDKPTRDDDEQLIVSIGNRYYSIDEFVDQFDSQVEINDKKRFAVNAIATILTEANLNEFYLECNNQYEDTKEELEGIVYCLELLQKRITAVYDLWYNIVYSPYNNKSVEEVADKLFIVFSFDC